MLYDPNWEPPETKTEEWRTILLKAADLIEEKGWVQDYYASGLAHCTAGAIARVVTGDAYDFRHPVVENALNKLLPVVNASQKRQWFGTKKQFESVPKWNDDPHTTKEEVVAIIRKAATT